MPAVISRSTSSTLSHKRKLTHEEKDKLLRIGKRARKGPFNAVLDHTEFGAGSALLEISEAAKKSGSYDVWTQSQEEEREENEEEEFVPKKAAPKVSPQNVYVHCMNLSFLETGSGPPKELHFCSSCPLAT